MRVHWISSETQERVTSAVDEALTPRDGFCASAHWLSFVELDIPTFSITGSAEGCPLDLDGFMTFLAMLAAPRPWVEPHFPRAFAMPVDDVNRIGRMVLGEGWPGIGALTLCDPEPAHGALTMSAAGALEVV